MKLRGFRIELGEIEAALKQQAGVRQCVVAVQGDEPAEQAAGGIHSANGSKVALNVENLREALKERLPNYMISAAFAVIEKMPLTPNGKIDRKGLVAIPITRRLPAKARVVTPRDSIEAELVRFGRGCWICARSGFGPIFSTLAVYSLMVIKLFTQINKVSIVPCRSLPSSNRRQSSNWPRTFGDGLIDVAGVVPRCSALEARPTP